MIAPELEASPADWDNRALCPDDSCIGVLDAQGLCSTCGKQGDMPAERRVSSPYSDDDATDEDADVTAGAAASSSSQDGDAASGEFADRELCPDESCIGLLDDAGACKVCGKRS